MVKEKKIIEALRLKSEFSEIDFKKGFDKSSTQDWCEIVKDLVAILNSGGGAIIFGVEDNGNIVGGRLKDIFEIDPAVITDKVNKYTGVQIGGFQINSFKFRSDTLPELKEYNLPVLQIPGSEFPIPFNKAGNYGTDDGKQKTAFSKGTVYFRHGAKSEPSSYNDIRTFFDRKLKTMRELWFKNINKVMEAPLGSSLKVLPAEVIETKDEGATKIKLTDSEDAYKYKKIDPDKTHPFRQMDLIEEVNQRLDEKHQINSYDILSIRNAYDLDNELKFIHNPKFGSKQYSNEFVDWIIESFNTNPTFFSEARAVMYEIRYGDK
jgi:hypothetical protein